MPKEIVEIKLRRSPGEPWGLRIGGGVDRGKVLVLEKIIFNSVAYEAGLKNRDYIYEVNGVSVLEMSHEECTKLIKNAGDSIDIKIERGDHIVPNIHEAFPQKKVDEESEHNNKSNKDRPYWIQNLEAGKGVKNSIGFTTVGKPKIAQKQYNSPLEMYSEDALEEIMKDGTLGGKPIDPTNLMNPTGKEFEAAQSSVCALIMEAEKPMTKTTGKPEDAKVKVPVTN